MAKQIEISYTIKVSGSPNNYSIEAYSYPLKVSVEPHPFVWLPSPEYQKTIDKLISAPRYVKEEDLIKLGNLMYKGVFIAPIQSAFEELKKGLEVDNGIRIKLLIQPTELSIFPWEIMHDGKDFIALRSDYPLVRGANESLPYQKATIVRGPLKILYAWSNPSDLEEIDPGKSAKSIEKALVKNKKIKFKILPNATIDKLKTELDKDYHVLCFGGHGDKKKDREAEIFLEEGEGSQSITANDLIRSLEGKNTTRLIFLAACDTDQFARDLSSRAEIPAIIGMRYKIYDNEANRLVVRFFESLAAFRPIDASLAEARKSIADTTKNIRDVFSPTMYLQSKTSHLFQRGINRPAILFATAFIVSLIMVIVAAIFGVRAIQQKEIAQATAVAESKISRAGELANFAKNELSEHPIISLLLSVESLNVINDVDGANTYSSEEVIRNALKEIGGIGLVGHINSISTIAISADGRWLATGSTDSSIRLWDLKDPDFTKKSIVLNRQEGWINTILFSPDNHYIITGSLDPVTGVGSAILWNLTSSDPSNNFVKLIEPLGISAVAFSPDNRWVVVCGDEYIRLWNLEDLKSDPIILTGHKGLVKVAVFSPNGRWLATGGMDKTIHLWDLWSNSGIYNFIVLDGHKSRVNSLVFANNGNWLISGSGDEYSNEKSDNSIRVWDLKNLKKNPNGLIISQHDGPVFSIVVSPNGEWLASASAYWDHKVFIWKLNFSDPSAIKPVIYDCGDKSIVNLSWSMDSLWLAIGSNKIILLNMGKINNKNWESVRLNSYQGDFNLALFSPDNKWLISGGEDGTVRLWNSEYIKITNVSEVSSPIQLQVNGDNLNSFSFLPGDKVIGHGNNALYVWPIFDSSGVIPPVQLYITSDTITNYSQLPDGGIIGQGKRALYIWQTSNMDDKAPIVLLCSVKELHSLAISAGGELIAAGGNNGQVCLWNYKHPSTSAKILKGFNENEDVKQIIISADGAWLSATSNRDNILWDLVNDKIVYLTKFYPENQYFYGFFSPDNKWYLALGEQFDKQSYLWNLKSIDSPPIAIKYQDEATKIGRPILPQFRFSSDSHWLITYSSYGIVRIWDLTLKDVGKKPLNLPNFHDYDPPIAISPDSKKLAITSKSIITILDLFNTNNLLTISGDKPFYKGLVFGGNNQTLISTDRDGKIALWKINDGIINFIDLDHNVESANTSQDQKWFGGIQNGVLYIWPLKIEYLKHLACQTAGRNLSLHEWHKYFPGKEYRKICPELPNHPEYVLDEFNSGIEMAHEGKIEQAVTIFNNVAQQEPGLIYDPKKQAMGYYLSSQIGYYVDQNKIDEAIRIYFDAKDQEISLNLSANSLSNICYSASYSFPLDVLETCDMAVLKSFDEPDLYTLAILGRGISMAQLGNYKDALINFEYLRQNLNPSGYQMLVTKTGVDLDYWITELEEGKNPIK